MCIYPKLIITVDVRYSFLYSSIPLKPNIDKKIIHNSIHPPLLLRLMKIIVTKNMIQVNNHILDMIFTQIIKNLDPTSKGLHIISSNCGTDIFIHFPPV